MVAISNASGKQIVASPDLVGVPAEQVLFVGDEPHADMCGAHQAGMRTAWRRRGRSWPGDLAPEWVDVAIDSVGALIDALGLAPRWQE